MKTIYIKKEHEIKKKKIEEIEAKNINHIQHSKQKKSKLRLSQ